MLDETRVGGVRNNDQIQQINWKNNVEEDEDFSLTDKFLNNLGSPYEATNPNNIPDTPKGLDLKLYDNAEIVESTSKSPTAVLGESTEINSARVVEGKQIGEKVVINKEEFDKVEITKTEIKDNQYIINPDDPENCLVFNITDDEAKFLRGKSIKQLKAEGLYDLLKEFELDEKMTSKKFIVTRQAQRAIDNLNNIRKQGATALTNQRAGELDYTTNALKQLLEEGTLPEGYKFDSAEEKNIRTITATHIKDVIGTVSDHASPQEKYIAKTTYEALIRLAKRDKDKMQDETAKKMYGAQLAAYEAAYKDSGLKGQSEFEKKLNAFKDVLPGILMAVCQLRPEMAKKMSYIGAFVNAFNPKTPFDIEKALELFEKSTPDELEELTKQNQLNDERDKAANRNHEQEVKKITNDAEITEAQNRQLEAQNRHEELTNPTVSTDTDTTPSSDDSSFDITG